MSPVDAYTVKRFWAKVRRGAGCWEWQGPRHKVGYGALFIRHMKNNGKQWYAHRLSYLIHNGELPKGASVLHSCDNPPCVNPAHLRLGSRVENNLESTLKGRRNKKLSWEQVCEIRKLRAEGWLLKDLGKKYGVDSTHIGAICLRKKRTIPPIHATTEANMCPKCLSTNIKQAWATQLEAQMFCKDCNWSWLQPLESVDSDEDLYPAGAPYTDDLREIEDLEGK